MLMILTGQGKGKTTSAVGQAVRALGQGLPVAFGQFMKRPDQAGEQRMLERLLGDCYLASGEGFFRDPATRERHRAAAARLLEWAWSRLGSVRLLVLDEALYALGAGLMEREELEPLLDEAKTQGVHLLLTGRGLPDWLRERADLITEMHAAKHPLDSGVHAAQGIEY